MRGIFAAGMAIFVAEAATASEKPLVGPPAAWVKPMQPLTASAGKNEGAPVRILLQDQQVSLRRGQQTIYSRTAMRIGTSQGLAAGQISFPWRPETDEITVHALLIRRGDQVIDVLGSGQTFTVVRREVNLESAMLDGVLTATIQPEGLQVGDVLDFAMSYTTADPTLGGHVEQLAGAWNQAPIDRAHLRVQWPSTLPVRWRQTGSLPPIKPVTAGGTTSFDISLTDIEPVPPPKGAPIRFAMGRLIEVSDYRSWAEIAELMAPLYARAAMLPAQGSLAAEVARLRSLSSDPKVRAQAALTLVQDRIRYVALAMGTGGLVPVSAEETWSRRYGDCKGKTALLLGLLRALDVDAEPVLVNTVLGDGLNERLPMVGLFNHVLVRAEVGGRAYWLDGTRTGDTSLDRLRTPPFGWGLPVRLKGGELVRMLPPPLDEPTEILTIRMDASAGISVPAPTRIEMLTRGDEALGMNMGLASLTPDARDRALRDYWRERYDFIDVGTVSASFNAERGEHRLVMDGVAKMDWSGGSYETDGTGIGYKADFRRDPRPGSDAPFAVPYPIYSKLTQTILLPPAFVGSKVGSSTDVDQKVAGIHYRRRAALQGNVFTVERSERSVAPEFAAKDAPAAQATLRALAENAVYVRVPAGYRPTEGEIAASLASTPTTAAGFISRGNILLNAARYDEAIADFDKAIALDTKDAWALANRGIARVWKDDAGATKDLDAAAAIDERNPVVFRARGLMAERKGEWAEAVATYTSSLEIEPGNGFALGHRALVHRSLGNAAAALADSAVALKLNPRWYDLRLMRANLHRAEGRSDDALAEAAALSMASSDDTYPHVGAAKIYSAFGRRAEAMAAFDRALAIKPEAFIYINRSQIRPKDDVAGRRADIEAALKLDPTDGEALALKAGLQTKAGDHAEAIRTWNAAVAAEPKEPGLLAARGIAHARAGSMALAEKDFAAARAMSGTAAQAATALNKICWAKATAGLLLQSALADCDAALGKLPDAPAFLDSRGLVLLRLGRLDEAIATYDRALARAPRQTSSLWGRSIARARKGDHARSAADAAAALKNDPDVRTEFEAYGVKP